MTVPVQQTQLKATVIKFYGLGYVSLYALLIANYTQCQLKSIAAHGDDFLIQ